VVVPDPGGVVVPDPGGVGGLVLPDAEGAPGPVLPDPGRVPEPASTRFQPWPDPDPGHALLDPEGEAEPPEPAPGHEPEPGGIAAEGEPLGALPASGRAPPSHPWPPRPQFGVTNLSPGRLPPLGELAQNPKSAEPLAPIWSSGGDVAVICVPLDSACAPQDEVIVESFISIATAHEPTVDAPELEILTLAQYPVPQSDDMDRRAVTKPSEDFTADVTSSASLGS
jgi:hypothetical protein